MVGVGGGGRWDEDAFRGGEEEPEQDRGGRARRGFSGYFRLLEMFSYVDFSTPSPTSRI